MIGGVGREQSIATENIGPIHVLHFVVDSGMGFELSKNHSI